MKISVGVDLHKTQLTVCYLSVDRKLNEFVQYSTNETGYKLFLSQLTLFLERGDELKVAVESTGNARYFRNRVLKTGIEVKVVNTMKFKVINESVKKTDKHDARTLAEFLEKDMLPESHLCSQESENIRRVLKSRSILVKARVSLKNQIHGLLLSYGIESSRGQLQSKRERQRILKDLADHKLNEHAAITVEPLFNTIEQLDSEINKLEHVLEELIKDDKDVELLTTIPGVGLITASTIRAYTDDINRYESSKKYSSHAGLVPWVQNSNTTIHHGHITKRGPVELRTAFVQVVMGMLRMSKKTGSYRLMTKYQSMKGNKGSGQSIIATARKISVIVYHMLSNQEPFDPFKMRNEKKYIEMQKTALKGLKIS